MPLHAMRRNLGSLNMRKNNPCAGDAAPMETFFTEIRVSVPEARGGISMVVRHFVSDGEPFALSGEIIPSNSQ